MLTVLRITAESDSMDKELVKIGEHMESVKKGSFRGLHKNAHWFACTVAWNPDFLEHREEILSEIRQFAAEIREARKLGLRVTLDVAIEPEDYRSNPYFGIGFDDDFLKEISGLGIGIDVTAYRP